MKSRGPTPRINNPSPTRTIRDCRYSRIYLLPKGHRPGVLTMPGSMAMAVG
jgi:hypothetical protein